VKKIQETENYLEDAHLQFPFQAEVVESHGDLADILQPIKHNWLTAKRPSRQSWLAVEMEPVQSAYHVEPIRNPRKEENAQSAHSLEQEATLNLPIMPVPVFDSAHCHSTSTKGHHPKKGRSSPRSWLADPWWVPGDFFSS
jgi:hypothetical protein